MKYYVYALVDPRNNYPFYIGKGSGNRFTAHEVEARGPKDKWTNALKCKRILSIWRSGNKVLHEKLFDGLTEDVAYLKESQQISKYGRLVDKSGYLTNIINEDRANPKHYKKVSQYSLTGKHIETYDSIQEAAEAVGVTPNTISGVVNFRTYKGKHMRSAGGYRWAHKGTTLIKYKTKEQVYADKHKAVYKCTLDGTIIDTYLSGKEAAEETGVDCSHISAVCHGGRRKTAGGFKWKFVNH